MRKKTPLKSHNPSFGDWKPTAGEAVTVRYLDRTDFAGLKPDEASRNVVAFLRSRNNLREATATQRHYTLRKILDDFAQRRLDLASLTERDVTEYREFLREMVQRKTWKESYAANLVKVWNNVARDAFGEKGNAGNGFLMSGFRMAVRQVQILSEKDRDLLLQGCIKIKFRNERNREAFRTYVELAFATGARVGSLMNGNLRVGDIDLFGLKLRLRHMKNSDEPHWVAIQERAAVQLNRWLKCLEKAGHWQGLDTLVFCDDDGAPFTPSFVDDALRRAAIAGNLGKPVSSHIIRKSVGTHIGKENPKLAAQQLGITDAIFNRHYNQPTLEDRIQKRALLPGGNWKPPTPEEIAGKALLDLTDGKMPPEIFKDRLQVAQRLRQDAPETNTHTGYA